MARVKDALLLVGAITLLLSAEEAFLRSASASALVSGTVFCDQCKDGERSFFDYPLSGAKVAVACRGAGEEVTSYVEDVTNWFGTYTLYLDGSPDLSACYARVVEGPPDCGAAAGPERALTLLFRVLGMAMYAVQPLLSQPQQPTGFCPGATPSTPTPPALPFPQSPPTLISRRTPLLPLPTRPPPPPPTATPLFQASACSYEKWMMAQYMCSWRVVSPDTKVGIAFGPLAAGRFGTEMTLWDALHGRGDLYRTLLREGTASLLNSYNSLGFLYPTLNVIDLVNRGLIGSRQEALMAALRFRRANSGAFGGANRVSCNLSPCNS